MFAPVYITSANGVSENGEIVQYRTVPETVLRRPCFAKDVLYYVIGVNKIVPRLKMPSTEPETLPARKMRAG